MKMFSVNSMVLFLFILIFSSTCFLTNANAVTTIEHGVISIAFDDCLQSVYDYAFPLLANYSFNATFYAISSKVGDINYMNVSELQILQNAGNEIGSHSVTHAYFPSLTVDELRYECSESKRFLESTGLEVNNFAYPYGDGNSQTDSIVSQYYRSARRAYIPPFIMDTSTIGFNLTGYGGETGNNATLSGLRSFVDAVFGANGWAIIFFHNLTPGVTTDPYSISVADFSGFLNYVSSKGIPTMTVNEALDTLAPPPSPTHSPSSSPSPSPLPTVFMEGYETGDYSKWTGTINNTGSFMQISSTTVLEGVYSADCSISSAVGTYAFTYKIFETVPFLYHREYIRLSALPPNGSETDLFGIMDKIASGHHLGKISVQNINSSYRWKLQYFNNNTAQFAYSTQVALKANTWYYVEVMVKSGSGTGQLSIWIAEDKIAIAESQPTMDVVNLTNNLTPIGTAFFGGYVTGDSYPVHIFSDSVVFSDTWTGPRDFTTPSIGAVSATSHSIGCAVTLSSNITDDVGIDTIIPSWNNSGSWVNQTAIDAQGSKDFTATFAGVWSSNPGTVVSAVFYAKDTSNNWVASGQTNFTLNNYAVALSANQTGLTQEDTVRINVAVTKNGSPFAGFVANSSRDGSLFASNVSGSFNDRENVSISHLYTVSSLYDTGAGEGVSFTANTLNITWAKSVYVIVLSGNQSSLIQGDTVRVNLTVTKNGLPFNSFFANVSRDGALFASNVSSSFSDQQIHAVSRLYGGLSLYDAVTGENVTFSANTINATWAKSIYSVSLFVKQTGITQGDTVNFYLNVTKNGLVFESCLANVTRDGVLFASNKTASFNDTENASIEHQYKVSSLYDETSSENVTFATVALNVAWAQNPPNPTPSPPPVPTVTPSTKPTPTLSPKPTPTSSPTITVRPNPTAIVTPSPYPTQEGLFAIVLIGLGFAAIFVAICTIFLLIRWQRLKTKTNA